MNPSRHRSVLLEPNEIEETLYFNKRSQRRSVVYAEGTKRGGMVGGGRLEIGLVEVSCVVVLLIHCATTKVMKRPLSSLLVSLLVDNRNFLIFDFISRFRKQLVFCIRKPIAILIYHNRFTFRFMQEDH